MQDVKEADKAEMGRRKGMHVCEKFLGLFTLTQKEIRVIHCLSGGSIDGIVWRGWKGRDGG